MAYAPKNLSALAYANGFTLWHYKTPDQPAEVDTSGYFNDAALIRPSKKKTARSSIASTWPSRARWRRAAARWREGFAAVTS